MAKQTCNRCQKLLGKSWINFLDRKYHEHPCYVITLVLYKRLKAEGSIQDDMSINQLNTILYYRQEFSLEEIHDLNSGKRDPKNNP